MIKKATLAFLRDLARHNDRDWFAEHKPRYEAARKNVGAYAGAVLGELSKSDVLSTESGKRSLFRIYRDVRFSKNKLPYKTNLGGSFTRDGRLRRGGYYFSIQPGGESVVGGGFYGIERDDLKRIREELARDGSEYRAIVADPAFIETFGEMQGERLKTAPSGYPRDHPNIDLLQPKQFYAVRTFSDAEVQRADFVEQSVAALLALRPFFDYFSEVLTTDGNGEVVG